MAKIILAFTIAFFGAMTVFASTAEACISCNYVPSVVNSPSKSSGAKRYKKERVNRAAKKRKARPAKKRAVKRKTVTKKVETAKTAPIKTETKNESSSISTAWSLGNSYVGCKTLSVGCIVANSGPSKMTNNLGRLSVLEPNQPTSGRQESPTLTRGAFGNTVQ